MKTNLMLKAAMTLSLLAAGCSLASACTMVSTSAGIMTISPDGRGMDSAQAGASQGTITVICDTTGIISVANPIPVGAGASLAFANGSNYGASILLAGTSYATINNTGASSFSPISSGVYSVHAWLSSGVALPAGDYAMTVTSSLVAN